MKAAIICLTALFAVVLADDQYTTKYDNVNVDEILKNERLYKKYFECLKGTGKCTPDAKELKDILPDALETKCSKCNDKQREGAEKVIKHLLDNKPDDYTTLEKIYDPTGSYKKRYQAEAAAKGIKV